MLVQTCHLSHLLVCLSTGCTVEKWLTGSGCLFGGEWDRSRDVCIRHGGDRRRERGNSGVNVGHPIITIRDFVEQLCEIA